MTSTKAKPNTSAVIEHHRGIAVTCTTCGQSFNDDFTHHFASSHALRIVASEDWVLTATGVLCWSCVDDLDDQRPAHTAFAVAKCEYCWPPLFSDTPAPDRCCCTSLAAATTHVLVPLVTLTHPGFEQHACVTIRCPECRSGVRAHDHAIGEPHLTHSRAARRGEDLRLAGNRHGHLLRNMRSDTAMCGTGPPVTRRTRPRHRRRHRAALLPALQRRGDESHRRQGHAVAFDPVHDRDRPAEPAQRSAITNPMQAPVHKTKGTADADHPRSRCATTTGPQRHRRRPALAAYRGTTGHGHHQPAPCRHHRQRAHPSVRADRLGRQRRHHRRGGRRALGTQRSTPEPAAPRHDRRHRTTDPRLRQTPSAISVALQHR